MKIPEMGIFFYCVMKRAQCHNRQYFIVKDHKWNDFHANNRNIYPILFEYVDRWQKSIYNES